MTGSLTRVAHTGALAFCGISHAGKTTVAFALSRRGYPIWADDVLAFEARGADDVRAVRLPFRLNLRAQTSAHFNAATEEASSADGQFEEWTRVPLAAVFALERVELSEPWSRSTVRRLSQSEALMAVLSHAFCFQPQTPQEKRSMMEDYLELLARVPVYSLTVGPRARHARRAARRGRGNDRSCRARRLTDGISPRVGSLEGRPSGLVFDQFTQLVADASGWAYAIVFVLAVLDAVVPVVPSETAVITAGVVASAGDLNLGLIIAAAAAGAFIGDNSAYLIGRRFGTRVEERFFSGEKARRRVAWAETQLGKRGGELIVVGRFIPGGRTAVTLSAGTLRYPWRRFVLFDAVAALGWATYASLLGYLGGRAFEDAPWKGLVLAIGIAFAVAGSVELVRWALKRRRRVDATDRTA